MLINLNRVYEQGIVLMGRYGKSPPHQ